jgi:predicted alpha/beta hydrolase
MHPGTPLTLTARDGFALAATLHPTPGPEAGAVVLVNSATGAPRRYYARFAHSLAERGLPTVTYDYRGIGDSRPASLRGFPARARDWGALDLAGAIDSVRERFPGRRLLVVGHSIGGQLVGLADNASEVSALLTVASGSGYYRLFPNPARMALTWYVLAPLAVRLFGRLPGWMGTSEDLPAGVAREWGRWCRHPDYLWGEDGPRRRAAYAALRMPLRAYGFTDDPIATPAAVRNLLSFYPGAAVEHREVSPAQVGRAIGHFGFFREPFRTLLWPQAADWLLAHATGAHVQAA